MGIDVERFDKLGLAVLERYASLLCAICTGVLDDPHYLRSCTSEHLFCRTCILRWIESHQNCPLDRRRATGDDLVKAATVSEILGDLSVYCVNAKDGCTVLLSLSAMTAHIRLCTYGPEFVFPVASQLEKRNRIRDKMAALTDEQEQLANGNAGLLTAFAITTPDLLTFHFGIAKFVGNVMGRFLDTALEDSFWNYDFTLDGEDVAYGHLLYQLSAMDDGKTIVATKRARGIDALPD